MDRLFIFDLDGTIADTIYDLSNSMNYVLNKNGYKTHELYEYKSFVGSGIYNLARNSLGDIKDELIIKMIYEEFIKYYEKHYLDKTKPYDKVLDILDFLKDNGYKLAVLSNKKDKFTKQICDTLFKNTFDFILGQKEDIPKKPDPFAVNLIMEKLKVKKENAVLLGDSDIDIITAKNAGIKSVGCAWGFRSKIALEKAGADEIYDTPAELLKTLKEQKIGL